MSARNPSTEPIKGPLIPEKFLDIPSQRLYILSLGVLCQAVKLLEFGWHVVATNDKLNTCRKWLLVDFTYCFVLSQLRIPRLKYSKAVVLSQVITLWFFDGLMFGGISLNLAGTSSKTQSSFPNLLNQPGAVTTPETFSFLDFVATYSFGLFGTSQFQSNGHLLGQHTVRMSPISTAQFYPNGQSLCLTPPSNIVLLPVLLNNTTPLELKYSVTPLNHHSSAGLGKTEYFDLSAKELAAIEQSRVEALQSSRVPTSANQVSQEYDEYDDDDDDDSQTSGTHSSLQKTQTLIHIKVTKPGIVRIERVLDSSNVEARLLYPNEMKIVPCPHAEFADDDMIEEQIRCAAQDSSSQLTINIRGVSPLSLRWSKIINGNPEQFTVEGVEGTHGHGHIFLDNSPVQGVAKLTEGLRGLQVPLTVTLDTLGTHAYILEEVADSVGNIVTITPDPKLSYKTRRSFIVLRRPAVSFQNCGPGRPTQLLIGSEAPLMIVANEADTTDSPWEILLRYLPLAGPEDTAGKGSKRFKPWQKTLKTQDEKRELSVMVNAPGEYVIMGVKGQYCTGDVLSPDTCTVIEKPLPTAEIQWKRIHECSGDTGVSASLVFHGIPPFTVYYRTQRDQEPAKELSKTFASARGELTLQPERSGHYTYTFVYMSDANYRKVELDGPSIDQIVHPLAAADFTSGQSGTGRKKAISSCSGSFVDVDVELKGTGPWNLELQVVGPRSTEYIPFSGLETPRQKLQVPIPNVVDKEGGSFEINLVSIEDSYGCKRHVSVPGVTVHVRRVRPTAKFYGKDDERHVTVLELEEAKLPLRLSGEGPWKIKYIRAEAEHQVMTATLRSPNDYLLVRQKGLYKLLEVADSQCPGSVIDGSTYFVNWVPRPFAKLSYHTQATFESYNQSYILTPICEGVDDHVDLELTGRPPFQIMYNVAQESEIGGTKLVDQSTFNSIQPLSRFQLQTSKPGRMYYEIKQIGDAAYPLSQELDRAIPRAERLLFEQLVFIRPSAQFKTRTRLSYCLNSPFIPADAANTDGIVLLEGTPPFRLGLSIKDLATSQTHRETIEVLTKVWQINLPAYHFKSVSPHLITIESVKDASLCPQANLDPAHTSIWVDVAETASIIPFDRRTDLCMGEISQFQLEGIPPWTIDYRINGRPHTQEAKSSPFSLVHTQPGEFVISSIAHQQRMCKAALTDLRITVHPLPSARVAHGKRILQDIHEGDQAEIVFTFIGEPPFTFTYQRAENSLKKGGKPGKVLETHTVSRVTSHEYSIFSALEGTWTVTSISDRYCRYPPASPDITADKKRS